MLRSTEYYCQWIICIRCLREGFSVLLTGTNALCFQQYQKEKHAGNPCLNKHAGNPCLNKHAGNLCLNKHAGNPCLNKNAGNPCLNKHAGNLCLNKHAGNPCLNKHAGNPCLNKHAGNLCLNKHAGNLCLNKHEGNPCLNCFWKVIWKEVNIIFWGSKWDLMNLILCWVCFCDFCNISLLQLSPLILRDKIKFYIKVPPKGIHTKMFSNSPSITRFQIHFK